MSAENENGFVNNNTDIMEYTEEGKDNVDELNGIDTN